jgi:hypothetical protein
LGLKTGFRLGLGLELESSSLYPIILDIFLFTGEARVQESRFFLKKSWISLQKNRVDIAQKKTNCYDKKKGLSVCRQEGP